MEFTHTLPHSFFDTRSLLIHCTHLLQLGEFNLHKPYSFITTWEFYSLSHFTLLLQFSQLRSSLALCSGTLSFFETRRSLNHYNFSQLGSSLIQSTPLSFDAGETHSLTTKMWEFSMMTFPCRFILLFIVWLFAGTVLFREKGSIFRPFCSQYVMLQSQIQIWI